MLYFLCIKGYTRKSEDAAHNIELVRQADIESIVKRFEKRLEVCTFAVEWLYQHTNTTTAEAIDKGIQFSVIELLNDIKKSEQSLFNTLADVQLEDVEEALLYLSKIGALKLEGGFLVLYNAMDIRRLKDNRLQYKKEDYRMLNEFYRQKIQQVHIVGEYANLMVCNYDAALKYVHDYFQMDYRNFIQKYFKAERVVHIERNITTHKYNQLFRSAVGKALRVFPDFITFVRH